MGAEMIAQIRGEAEFPNNFAIYRRFVGIAMFIQLNYSLHKGFTGNLFQRLERLVLNAHQLQEAGVPIKERAVEIEENGQGLWAHAAYHYPARRLRVG